MAEPALTSLLQSIDEYMKSSGKGGTKYLATKIAALFSDNEAPFNAKSTIFRKMKNAIKAFSEKLEDFTNNQFDAFYESMRVTNINLFKFYRSLDTSTKALDQMVTHIQSVKVKTPSVKIPATDPKSPENLLTRTVFAGFNMLQTNTTLLNNSIVNGFSAMDNVLHTMLDKLDMVEHHTSRILHNLLVPKQTALSAKTPDTEALEKINATLIKNTAVLKLMTKEIKKRDIPIKDKDDKENVVWSWIKNIFKSLAEVYLLGKVKQFLDTTEFGKSIKNGATKLITTLFQMMGTRVKTGDFSKTMTDAALFISDSIAFVYNKTKTFLINNQENIKNQLNNMMTTIWEKILYPLGEEIYNVTVDMLKDIFKNLISGDMNKLALDSGLLSALGLLGGFLSKKVIGSLGGIAESLTSVGARLGLITIALVAAQNRIEAANKKALDATEAIKDSTNADNSEIEGLNNMLKKLKAEKQSMETDTSTDHTEQLKLLVDRIDNISKIIVLKKDQLEKKTALNDKGFFSALFTGNSNMNELLEKSNNDLNELYKKDTEAQKNLRKLKSVMEGDKESNRKKVNDAVIVEPHSKDQIIMGKKGGPFDDAFNTLNKKFDTLLQVFAQGMGTMAQTTIEGSQGIIQAVVATSGNSGATTMGGSDPIRDLRMRSIRNIEP